MCLIGLAGIAKTCFDRLALLDSHIQSVINESGKPACISQLSSSVELLLALNFSVLPASQKAIVWQIVDCHAELDRLTARRGSVATLVQRKGVARQSERGTTGTLLM